MLNGVKVDKETTRYYINYNLAGECKTGEINNISMLINKLYCH
jgi:hypothetical protein